ncbi:MAG: glycosyltransferase family 39 protein [Candidatus Omnitrophota bacterium]|jgi:4-amino-4-deoxy-L-arabinose transferase-like glycosyltransferase
MKLSVKNTPNALMQKKYINRLIILGLIIAAALTLRVYKLDSYTLWHDEATSVLDSRGLGQLHSLGKLFDRGFTANHQDYLTLYDHGFIYYWQKLFGRSEFALRFSSVIFAILSVFFIYLLAKKFLNIKVACLTSFILAISPFHIYYSQELRPYAATCLLTLISAYLLLKILEDNRGRYWLAYALVNVLNVYFLYTNLIILFSSFVFMAWKARKERGLLKSVIFTHFVILFLLAPLLLTLYQNFKLIIHSSFIYGHIYSYPWAEKAGFMNLLYTFKNFSIGYNTDYYSLTGKFATLVCFCFFIAGIYKYRKNNLAQLAVFFTVIPVLLLFFLSRIKACYVYRYFFPVLPFYLLGVGAGLGSFKRRFLLILLISALFFLGLKNYYLNSLPWDYSQHIGVSKKQDLKGIFKIILGNYQKGDKIFHTSKSTVFPFKFYTDRIPLSHDLRMEIDRGRVIYFSGQDEGLLIYENRWMHPAMFFPEKLYPLKDSGINKRLWLFFSSFGGLKKGSEEDMALEKLRKQYGQKMLTKSEGANLYLFTKTDG